MTRTTHTQLFRRLILAVLILAMLTPANAADYQAGLEAYEQGDYAAAFREWRPLAEQGHAAAQSWLGHLYTLGIGVPQHDLEAVKWYRKAAEQGYAAGQFGLGLSYAHGLGVPENHAEAMKWFRKAAEQGHVKAQYMVAFFTKGMGVEVYAWLNIAAAQGDEDAKKDKQIIAKRMTREELARAQELSREYWKLYVLPFQN